MASTGTPTTVSDLLAKVGQHTANIQKHRDAMAVVSAQIAATPRPVTPTGGDK